MFDKFKDECGVFGIFGHAEAANLTYLGLYALQHRGQESAGIASADGARIRASRAMGYVNDAFDSETLAGLTGHLAVGHVRYSTAGESRLANAQPIVIDSAHGQLALGHNGNLINAGELRDALVSEGAIFQTSTDSEVVVHLFARSKARQRRGGDHRRHRPGARRLLVRADDEGPDHRRARPARLPAAGARTSRRRLGDLLGNLRHGPHRRHLRARRRARRDGDRQRRGPAVDEAVCAARSTRSASSSTSTSRAPTATCSERASTRCAPSSGGGWRASPASRPTSSCRFPTRACARRSAMPSSPAFRCGWASSATTTSAARSSSRSSRSATSACA